MAGPVLPAPLKIGDVSRLSGLTVKTIRFYCDEGLIQPSSRSEGGYRLFDEAVFAELTLIRTVRAMRRSGVCTCSDLKARIRSKAGAIGETIVALQGLQAELFGMLDRWEACGGRAPDPAPAVLVATHAEPAAEQMPGQGRLKEPTPSLARPRGLQRVVVPYHC